MTVRTHALLGDLAGVPADYVRGVAETKRFLERWTMDPAYREEYAADPVAALRGLGLSLAPEQVRALVDHDEALRVTGALRAGQDPGCPDSVLHYRAFIAEKTAHRATLRDTSRPSDPALATWRGRQLRRCQAELGLQRSDAIVHAPFAVELSEGCTVGCWFCGVSAPRFDRNFAHTEENATLWRECLAHLGSLLGPTAGNGFLYWATDPLDNPDYEAFLTDFHTVLGRCPQTTTAQGPKDVERTRGLLQLAGSLDSSIDRFSIIALNHLHRLHAAFTPEELLRVECVPQNKESSPEHLKSNAGRARRFTSKRTRELVPEQASSTIACVSGFLISMPARRVQLITPCNATDDWPLGYWVLDEGHFTTGAEFRDLLEQLINRSVRVTLSPDQRIALRAGVRVESTGAALTVADRELRTDYAGYRDTPWLCAMIAGGTCTAGEIATRCQQEHGRPLLWTYGLLTALFDAGVLDEAPTPQPPPRPEPVALPLPVRAAAPAR